ncbi:MAG: hypothetical protein IT423_09670, partial [Pirellulaceae bacterium]|nr:hypothetical protein [Pirellulaceae bacterium]
MYRLALKRLCMFSFLLLALASPRMTLAQTPDAVPAWVWAENVSAGQKIALRREFDLNGEVKQALVVGTADNHCELFLNGKRVFKSDDWNELGAGDVTRQLNMGKNVLAMSATNDDGAAGAVASLIITYADGKKLEIVTDASWKVNETQARGAWRNVGFKDDKWAAAKVLGKLGDDKLPWSASLGTDSIKASLGTGSKSEF